jgi:hypothetical protein
MQDNTDTKKQEIANLKHHSSKLPWGGEVVLLETGAIITAEDTAMIQALHSRDPKGIHSHLEKLAKSGSGKMMESFYVGYGHKSIGDCASTTIFIEGCSMLAAKAIQQSALYNDQYNHQQQTHKPQSSTDAFSERTQNEIQKKSIKKNPQTNQRKKHQQNEILGIKVKEAKQQSPK